MIVTQATINACTQGFRAIFLKAYQDAVPAWAPIAMEVSSSHESENYEFLTGLPGMREMVGAVEPKDIATSAFTIRNKEWESTVPVKRSIIERDSLGVIRPQMAELGTIARFHPQILVASLLNNGFTDLDYTGAAFFAANKPLNPQDSSRGARKFTNNGTAALNAASFVAARTSLRKRTDDKGNNLNLGGKLLLVVPPALEEVANRLRTAELLNTGAGAETNTLKGTFDVLVINQLASDTAWFLFDTSREIKPLVVQFEVKPEFIAADDPRSTHVLLQKVFYYQAYGRWNAGYGMPQLAYGSNGTVGVPGA